LVSTFAIIAKGPVKSHGKNKNQYNKVSNSKPPSIRKTLEKYSLYLGAMRKQLMTVSNDPNGSAILRPTK
jgi:hypothetical protein